MNIILTKITTIFLKKPNNAFLLLLTGFIFTLTMLSNVMHIIHPHGGWVTSMGTFTTRSILMTLLVVLALCLVALWRSSSMTKAKPVIQPQLSIPKSMLTSA